MRDRSADRLVVALAATMTAASVLAIVRIVRFIPLKVSLDPNEGWNAFHAIAAYHGTLYPDPPRFFFNNYPPVSFLVVGGVARLVDDAVVAGRILNLASFLALTALAAIAARRMHCSWIEAGFGAALFASMTLATTHYVGINDPQFLGQVVSAAAVPLLVGGSPSRPRLVFAALAMSLGLFTKHNVVATPIAAIVWLWFVDRRAALRLAACAAAFGCAGLALAFAVYGRGFAHALTAPRGFDARVLPLSFIRWVIRVPAFVAAVAVLLRARPREPPAMFCVVYVAVASLTGLWFLAGDGVDWNVMFESNWACCVCTAVALNRASARVRPVLAVGSALVPTVAAALAIQRGVVDPAATLAGRASRAPAFADAIAQVAAAKGAVVCDDLAVCYWAGKPAEVDFVNLRQQVKAGGHQDESLAWLLERHAFAIVQVQSSTFEISALLDDALRASYVQASQSEAGILFVPRR